MRKAPLPTHAKVLDRLELPRDLISLVQTDKLLERVEEAHCYIDALNAQLDAWEASNPTLAAAAPWHSARESWKVAGRPRAPWWEALQIFGQFPAVRRFGDPWHGGNNVLRLATYEREKHNAYRRAAGKKAKEHRERLGMRR